MALALRDAAEGLGPLRVKVLLENTAGSGAALGSRFEELQRIRELAGELTDLAVGYCLDTCHLLAAGFDIASPAGLRETVRHADNVLGLDHVYMFHANDSKAPRGSRVDRHANIGEGHIGIDAFRRILAHPKLRGKPFVLETPVDQPGDDRRNLDMLNELARAGGVRIVCDERPGTNPHSGRRVPAAANAAAAGVLFVSRAFSAGAGGDATGADAFRTEEGKPEPDLALARHTIDMMAFCSRRRRAISLEEQRLLENSLTELRFRFVQVSDEAGKAAAPDA